MALPKEFQDTGLPKMWLSHVFQKVGVSRHLSDGVRRANDTSRCHEGHRQRCVHGVSPRSTTRDIHADHRFRERARLTLASSMAPLLGVLLLVLVLDLQLSHRLHLLIVLVVQGAEELRTGGFRRHNMIGGENMTSASRAVYQHIISGQDT